MDLPTPAALFGMVVFSCLGLWAFREGKRETNIKELMLGMALMVYSYFTPETWMLWVVGAGLTYGVFACRDSSA
jgi:hypothetical protein